MAGKSPKTFDPLTFLATLGEGQTALSIGKDESIFPQGEVADAVFYVKGGKVKLTVISHQGKEALVAMLKEGDFFGEACLAGQVIRLASATSLVESAIVGVGKVEMICE